MSPGRILQQDRQFSKARMICAMFEHGWTYPEIIEATGMTRSGIHALLKTQQITPSQRLRPCRVDRDRVADFCTLRRLGWTNKQIGDVHGITPSRVQQIISTVPGKIQRPTATSERTSMTPAEKYEAWRTKWKARILECRSEGCWIWDGPSWAPNPKAPRYLMGRVSAQFTRYGYDIQFRSAHRLSYFLFKGDIGPYMTIDHTCHNPLCVNPDHLTVCSTQANSSRHSPEWHKNVRNPNRKKKVAA